MGEVLLPLVLPHIPDLRRVIYTIYEYDPLLDSSNMTMDDWIQVKTPKINLSHFKMFDLESDHGLLDSGRNTQNKFIPF